MSAVTRVPAAIEAATTDQPAARIALASAATAPTHAYLLAGPPGSGKREAARGLAAELLADGAPDQADARRRALADPSPHPDLVWVSPPGTQHLVDEVRERIINAAAYKPFEGSRRVFVIEAADAMAEESQNALLKTLEEPAGFATMILISSEPEALLETVRSRCIPVRFSRLAPAVVEERLGARSPGAPADQLAAAARLAGGDTERGEFLLTPEGAELREAAIECVGAARRDELGDAPWRRLLEAAEAAGERAGSVAREAVLARAAEIGEEGAAAKRATRDADELARRAARRARTDVLDLGLELICAWLRDLAAVAEGATELALNADRRGDLEAQAADLDPVAARVGAELAMETRRRLQVNVSEELAVETLVFRLESTLARPMISASDSA